MVAQREVWRGLVAAVAALGAMGGTAVVGLLLLGVGRVGEVDRMTAAVVAMAVGGSVELGAVPGGRVPFALQGNAELVPSGVALAGAVVLGWLLLRHPLTGERAASRGLLVRVRCIDVVPRDIASVHPVSPACYCPTPPAARAQSADCDGLSCAGGIGMCATPTNGSNLAAGGAGVH